MLILEIGGRSDEFEFERGRDVVELKVEELELELETGTGGGGMDISTGEGLLSSPNPATRGVPVKIRLFFRVTAVPPLVFEPEADLELGLGVFEPELELDPDPDPDPEKDTNPVVVIDRSNGVEVVEFEPLYGSRREAIVAVVVAAVEVEEVEGELVSFPLTEKSSPSLGSQSRSPPCIGSPPAPPLAKIKSSLKTVEADGGGDVGVANLSVFSPFLSAPPCSFSLSPRTPLKLLRPVILKVGLIAGLCLLRGLIPASSSLVLADRLLFVVEVVMAGREEEMGREVEEEDDDEIVLIGIGPPTPRFPLPEVGLAPSQGLVKGLISWSKMGNGGDDEDEEEDEDEDDVVLYGFRDLVLVVEPGPLVALDWVLPAPPPEVDVD